MAIDPFASLLAHARALADGRCSSVELTSVYLDRIARCDARLHAFSSVDAAGALDAARQADARRAAGASLGVLDGLPIAVKDLFEIEGQITTFGCAAWTQRRSATTAKAIERLLAAGMAVLGKTHMTEFAFGLWGTNPLMGTPWNPWDPARHRIPGGSSSGSAVAVAAGLAPAAIGSDTGGSVRIPAALNGLTGLKTTHGLITLEGALALSPTLDSIGPLCRDTADAALLTRVMAGALPPPDADAACASHEGIVGLRIAVLGEADFPMAVAPAALHAMRAAEAVLLGLGAELLRQPFPFDLDELARHNGRLIAAEAWRIHCGYAEDSAMAIGPWVRQRVLAGKAIDDEAHAAAVAHHRQSAARWSAWMADADALLTPASPMAACTIAEVDEAATPLASFARAANYLGACALVLPAGFSEDGLPVGIQLMGRPRTEDLLLRIGAAFQRATDWHRRTPDVPC